MSGTPPLRGTLSASSSLYPIPRTALECLPLPVLLFEPSLRCHFANALARTFFGFRSITQSSPLLAQMSYLEQVCHWRPVGRKIMARDWMRSQSSPNLKAWAIEMHQRSEQCRSRDDRMLTQVQLGPRLPIHRSGSSAPSPVLRQLSTTFPRFRRHDQLDQRLL